MRMNRGTIVLIAALLVVIVAVLVINNNQASAPGVTPTAVEASGALLPGLTADQIVRYEVRDNKSGFFTTLTKDNGGAWHIDGTNTLPARDPDQSLINTTAGQIVTINYNNTFKDDQLATFGLDAPAYTITALTNDGKFYTLYIGAKAPTSSRYYAVLVNSLTPASTAEATTESGQAPQAIATENVTSAQQNGSSVVPPNAAESTAESTAETTAAAKKIFQGLQEARAQATAEATAESTQPAVENVTSAQENGSSVVSDNATVEPTMELLAPTAEPTLEVTAEATANVVQNPGVTLTGSQTIYVIPQTVVDTLTKWINLPPYAPLPTAVPTVEGVPQATELPTPLLEEGADSSLIPAGTPFATQEVTPEAAAAATAAS